MPLRLGRPVIAAAAIGVAITWSAAGSVPALASRAAQADQVRTQEWWLSALHITQAWQTTKGSGVTIALLDTGVATQHPDLTGSVISGPDFTNSGEKLGGQFFGIHGTAMASLIVGHGHGSADSDGVVGVAPGAKLLSVRVTLDSGDPLLSDSGTISGLPAAIAAGIRYAVANGAQVIDLPLDPGQSLSALTATPFPANPPATTSGQQPGTAPAANAAAAASVAGGSTAEQQAVQFALSKGVVLVAPAGDNNATTDAANFPAAYPGVISVGAFDSSFNKAPFTSHQSYVTLTAAGSGMIAAVPGGGYATVSSTSAASAIVTGIAALIKSQYPELTPAQVSEALTRGTGIHHSGGAADGSGAGTADAAKALAAAAAIAAPGLPRAGSGAVSSQLPSPPAVPAVTDTLAAKLKRDGIISLILLAVLLLPTLGYALFRRRRSKVKARPQAEPWATLHTPYAYNPAGDADLVSEYFAPMPGDPGFRGAGAESSGRWATVSGAGAPDGEGNGRGGDVADGPDGSAPGTGPVMPRLYVPFARLTVARPPKVSGSPPWGPAPRPDGELPWASEPGPLEPRPLEPPADPDRGEPAQPMAAPLPQRRPGTPRETRHQAGPAAGPNEPRTEPTGPPIYVWNPGASTDTFPAASGASTASAPGDDQAGDREDWQPYGWQGDSGR